MTKKVSFKNVSFKVRNRVIFSNFSFDFREGQHVCLIGPCGVGKTSLLKMVSEQIKYDGDILKSGICKVLTDFVVSENLSIYHYLDYKSLSNLEAQMVLKFLKFKDLSYSVQKLNYYYQLKVKLLKYIFTHPQFLFVDDIISRLPLEERKLFFQLASQLGITIFYVTSDIEDCLWFPYLVVMGSKGILIEGNTTQVLQEEKIMKRLGFSLPFFVELSLQLQSYGLVDRIYLSGKELMNDLWK